jgi:hypothetical protein
VSPEQINNTLAKAFGITGWYCTHCKCQVPNIEVAWDETHSPPNDECGASCNGGPDYFGDLNSVRELELKLTDDEYMRYYDSLSLEASARTGAGQSLPQYQRLHVSADAPTRCRHILKVLGLWSE